MFVVLMEKPEYHHDTQQDAHSKDESWIWHPLLIDLEMHPTQALIISPSSFVTLSCSLTHDY
jgi:hypothetical protein